MAALHEAAVGDDDAVGGGQFSRFVDRSVGGEVDDAAAEGEVSAGAKWCQYVLIEAFKDDAAEAHVTSEHFKKAQADLPQYVQETPHIRNVQMDGDHWDRLGEFEVG